MLGLRFPDGGWVVWEELGEDILIERYCQLIFESRFDELQIPFSINLRTVEEMYAWMGSLELPAMVRRSEWGLNAIQKAQIIEIFRYWRQQFLGSTPDEVILRWTQMAHSDLGMELMSIPLTPGGPVTFSGVIS